MKIKTVILQLLRFHTVATRVATFSSLLNSLHLCLSSLI
uniref:Uncharacterized protein n=1 Tax=Anguilla anguilla TaxID=7936 RepID=A0A0E9UN52_ANGAN